MLLAKEQGRVFRLFHQSPCGCEAWLAHLVTCISRDMLLLPVILRKIWLSLFMYPGWCFKVILVVIFKLFHSVFFSSRIIYCLDSYICINISYISSILKFFFIFVTSWEYRLCYIRIDQQHTWSIFSQTEVLTGYK